MSVVSTLTRQLVKARAPMLLSQRSMSGGHHYVENTHELHLIRIGNREIVGYGFNGLPYYTDRADLPFPAIRYKEPTPEILALHEKEKGDWRNLTLEEKKTLYRASFCETFAEMNAPSGEWKLILGMVFLYLGTAAWLVAMIHSYVLPEFSRTLSPEHEAAMLKRMIDLKVDPVFGLSSKWDYENMKWKDQ